MSRWPRLAALALVFAAGSTSHAKGPTLTGLFPAGAARGQAVIVTASGSFDRWPVQAWSDDDLAIEARPARGKLEIRIDPDATPGIHWVRLYDDEGSTAPRPFVVGTLPELVEAEPNDDPRSPQAIPRPSATVNGRLGRPGDVDGFAVDLRRGETMVADVEANRHLGSPMDAVLQVVSASGFVLAQNDDAVGRDPRIVFNAPDDGRYVVRLFAFPATPDSSIRFAGGESFVYRLTLTTGGFLDLAFPLAVSSDRPAKVAAFGPNVLASARLLEFAGEEGGHDSRRVWHPLLSGTAEVRVVTAPAEVENESGDPAHLQALPDRGAISGRIGRPGERDTFRFALKKGERRRLAVESRSLGLPLDPVLRVADTSGKILAESDDKDGPDPELAFAAPADGEYRVVVRDLNGRGGPRFAYLLRVLAPDPDFALAMVSDIVEVTPGKVTTVAVTIARKDGFGAAIEVVAEGLPGGVTASPAVSRPGDASAKKVEMTFRADGCARPGTFRVVGRASGDGPPRPAVAPIAGFAARTDRPWLSIRPAPHPAKP